MERKIAEPDALWCARNMAVDTRRALHVNGRKVDETDMPTIHINTYSLADTFDVGRDTGTQVDPNYEGNPFVFTGCLDRGTITLND